VNQGSPGWWDELAVTALLGTDRRGPELGSVVATLPGELGAAARRLTGDAPGVLLDTAALAVGYRRGGFPAEAVTDDLAGPPEELGHGVTPQAAARLREVLAEGDLDLLVFWCESAAAAGKVAPPERLPALLDLAARQPVLRPAVNGVLGARGRWLATLNPAWELLRPPPAVVVGDLTVWLLGPTAQRVAWLTRARRDDRATAHEALTSSWAGEPGATRATLIAALEESLGPDDEAFLEAALDDRRKDVRGTAADLLSRLPSSRLAGRMRERALRLVRTERGLLRSRHVLQVPDELDDAAARDGITDQRPSGGGKDGRARRAWWVEQIVAATPLTTWAKLFGSPEAAVAAKIDGDDAFLIGLRAGWAWAAVRQRDSVWAGALLRGGSRLRADELLTLLEGEELAAGFRGIAKGLGAREIDTVRLHLSARPAPWPPELGRSALEWLLARAPELEPRRAWLLLTLLAHRLPLELLPQVRSAVAARSIDDPWRPALGAVVRTMSIRLSIHEELQ
jgi:uncharacterized protein DUF5691